MSHQKANRLPLKFKVAEAKQKAAEAQQVRLESLKRKKAAYVETSDNERKKKKGNDGDLGKVQKDGTKAQRAERPKACLYLNSDTRKLRLLALANFAPYQSLVLEVLKSATAGSGDGRKVINPAWLSWDTDNVDLGPEFFQTTTPGYLSNLNAVVEWMGSNPHIASEVFQGRAAEILLTVGLAYRGAKECANADPDSPLGLVPFEIRDLVEVEDAIRSMLAQTKKGLKFGVSQATSRSIENGWRKVCLEVGFSEGDIKTLGKDWKSFVETYAIVDCMLSRSGKPPQPHATNIFPEALQIWSQAADPDGNPSAEDETDWEEEMKRVSSTIQATVQTAQSEEDLDSILDADWCRRGRGGMVCVVLGMKWWRMSFTSKDSTQLGEWGTILTDLTSSFKIITEAKSIKRPESRRS
ncbi:hypothetical protein B0H14DRAFT_2800724 [Mycena olivaceomarginata]|nr:hypothetical protein B0H14DRAFT_2800724 [Mycena olivaceomarginata]